MPASQELIRTPSGSLAADLLREAHLRNLHPEPSPTAYGRVAAINFSPYWTDLLKDFRDNYNGNPAGYLAHIAFSTAEDQEGIELQVAVAGALVENFAEFVLEADIDFPELYSDNAILINQELSPLAQLLVTIRDEVEGKNDPSVFKNPHRPRDISDSWITFAHVLASADPATHDFLFEEMEQEYAKADIETEQEMKMWEGMMGGYGIFDRYNEFRRVAARTLAHFPDLVISRLKAPGSGQPENPQPDPQNDTPDRLALP